MCQYCNGKGYYTLIPSRAYRMAHEDAGFQTLSKEEKNAFLDKFRVEIQCDSVTRKLQKEIRKHGGINQQEPQQGADIRAEDSDIIDRSDEERVQTLPL